MSRQKTSKRPAPVRRKPGPEAERLKIDVSFEAAAAQVVKVPRPANGWPKTPEKRRKN